MPYQVCNQVGCEDGLCEEHLEECIVCDKKIDVEKDDFYVDQEGEFWCKGCIGKNPCSYCDEYVDKLRPSPFMSDIGQQMCKECWNFTKEEYANSNEEYIGEFEDYPHFKE